MRPGLFRCQRVIVGSFIAGKSVVRIGDHDIGIGLTGGLYRADHLVDRLLRDMLILPTPKEKLVRMQLRREVGQLVQIAAIV
jgi:hypothetical protein